MNFAVATTLYSAFAAAAAVCFYGWANFYYFFHKCRYCWEARQPRAAVMRMCILSVYMYVYIFWYWHFHRFFSLISTDLLLFLFLLLHQHKLYKLSNLDFAFNLSLVIGIFVKMWACSEIYKCTRFFLVLPIIFKCSIIRSLFISFSSLTNNLKFFLWINNRCYTNHIQSHIRFCFRHKVNNELIAAENLPDKVFFDWYSVMIKNTQK